MYDYNELKTMSQKARNKDKGYKLAHNTYVRLDGDDIKIRYHDTDIITVDSNNVFTIDNGGFFTKTTKERINEWTPLNLHQHQFKWYYGQYKDKTKEYYNNIKVTIDGTIVSKENKKEKRSRNAILKKIDKYARNLSDKLDTLEEPDVGDCWDCCGMFGLGSTDHLVSHINESYLMKRVYHNALKDAGYGPMALTVFGDDKKLCYRQVKKYLTKKLIT